MKKLKVAVIFAILLIFVGCSHNESAEEYQKFNKNSVQGFWEITTGNDEVIFKIDKDARGTFYGYVVTYSNNKFISYLKLGEIQFHNLNLMMVTNPEKNIVFKGILDTTKQVILGDLYFKNGKTFNFNFKRYTGPKCFEIEKVGNKLRPKIYKTIDELAKTGIKHVKEIAIDNGNKTKNESIISKSDIISIINRGHGTIFPQYENKSRALLLAFLLDPMTKQISDQWSELINNCSTTEEKVSLISKWTTANMAFTQADKQFANLPGKDPWGTMRNDGMPAFKKLITAEMKAMELYTNKISGKCFSLVNLITSCFIQLGVDPDDIIVVIIKSGNARHAMALVKFEERFLLVNLMLVDFLKNHIQKDFGVYEILGIYNHKFACEVNLQIRNTDLKNLITYQGETLLQKFVNYFNLALKFKEYDYSEIIPYSDRERLYTYLFKNNTQNPAVELAKYAYQSLYVSQPANYLLASLNASGPRHLAEYLKTEKSILDWVKFHVRYGSIFPDSYERLMTADQVLVFQRGSFKDLAVLAYTLLKHKGYSPTINISEMNAYLCYNEKIYDFKKNKFIKSIDEPVRMVLSEN